MEMQKGVEWKCKRAWNGNAKGRGMETQIPFGNDNKKEGTALEMRKSPGLHLQLVEVDAEEGAFDDHAEDVFEGEVGLLDVHRDLRGDDDDVIA